MRLTQENLKKHFKYDPETGGLFWLKRDGSLRRAGWKNEEGYLAVMIGGKRHRVHRIIWILTYGTHPEVIDHLNGDRADNRLFNLREASVADNNRNTRRRKDNTSGVTGVYRSNNPNKPWRAQIADKGRDFALGSYSTLIEAAMARKAAEAKFGFHKNHGRPETGRSGCLTQTEE
ncbi:HNH endonuclease [Sinorhizobium meliloti]|uniref:HNH endonuclease signature motif containing protein n=1 Tax=Rhizobium meliloti TaxID=382 RepID=UPI000FD23E5F|nr:HNH endonuclease signature motif containing protein [Sinorhizobium meliloti]RVL48458.1 HNH endonuclease [Sinorhizobium meliloti]RVL72392.1 HNH endonuclease [Sinorhizobium meliloti]